MNTDPWIDSFSILDPKRLHALGAVSARWNQLEYMTLELLAAVSKTDFEKARHFVHDLKMPSLLERVIHLSQYCDFNQPPEPDEVVDAIKMFAKAANICRENRNLLLHSIAQKFEEGDSLMRIKGPQYQPEKFSSSLEDIRAVADNIHTVTYVAKLIVDNVRANVHSDEKPPLPEIRDLPTRLWSPPNSQKKQDHN